MGAREFRVYSYGATADDAFYEAQRRALHDFGAGGYTGTFAEKYEYTMITDCTEDHEEHATKLLADRDKRITNKWGPAGCMFVPQSEDEDHMEAARNGLNKFFFFGMASD